jgi:hypothetical protein
MSAAARKRSAQPQAWPMTHRAHGFYGFIFFLAKKTSRTEESYINNNLQIIIILVANVCAQFGRSYLTQY